MKKYLLASKARLGLIVSLVMVSALCMATDPAPNDFTAALGQAKTDISSTLTTNGAALMGILIVALGFGIVWKLIKRAAKSV